MSDTFVDKTGRTRTRKTHCKHGHEFPQDARWVTNWKGYQCRACNECERIRAQRKREKPGRKEYEAEKMRQWREDNPEKYKRQYQGEFEKKRQVLADARSGGCVKCGEPDISCLDFHHRDPGSKLGHVGEFRKFGMKRLLAEIEKCDVLCANCHRKHHRDKRREGNLSEGD